MQSAFWQLLTNNEDVAPILADNGVVTMFPGAAPQYEPGDEPDVYIVYWLVARERARTLRGPQSLAQTRMQLDIYAREYPVAHNLAELVSQATDGFSGTVAVPEETQVNGQTVTTTTDFLLRSVELVTLEDINEPSQHGEEFGHFRVSIDYLIWHEMPTPIVKASE
jgi:hypothetical protein